MKYFFNSLIQTKNLLDNGNCQFSGWAKRYFGYKRSSGACLIWRALALYTSLQAARQVFCFVAKCFVHDVDFSLMVLFSIQKKAPTHFGFADVSVRSSRQFLFSLHTQISTASKHQRPNLFHFDIKITRRCPGMEVSRMFRSCTPQRIWPSSVRRSRVRYLGWPTLRRT